MGRKDAAGQHCAPVDQYRKQIGKHDWKKSRKEIKAMKAHSDEETALTAQNIALMIGVLIAIFSLLYMSLFWYLGLASMEDIKEAPPV